MIDVIISRDTLTQNLINDSRKITFEISADKWAPAVWAGCEGAILDVGERDLEVEAIDMEKRIVVLKEIIK